MNRRGVSLKLSLFLAILSILLFLSTEVLAGRHWLGGSRIDSGAPPLKAQKMGVQQVSPRIFNVVIQLYNDPIDNDRTPYEEMIRYFADAVYEATEGAHKIGKVSIYTNKCPTTGKADVVWAQSGHPSSDVDGYGVDGKHINMFDVFANGCGTACNVNFLKDDRIGGGYTLAHEWGHYTYGVYDEYKGSNQDYNSIRYMPHTDDDPVNPSIMNYQWAAKITGLGCSIIKLLGFDCGYEWLNFSIAWQEGGGDFRNTKKTAQHRMYEASGWETLARDTKDDPKDATNTARTSRTYWSELASVAPSNEPTIQLPSAEARSALEITWMTCKLAYQIVLDKSGSMGGDPGTDPNKIINARNAASWLVDVAEVGKTAIGVIAFNQSVQVVQPIKDINNDADKTSIKNAIAGITSGGSTALGDAAQNALNALLSQISKDEGRVVFLLSDGLSNTGSDPYSVIPSYQANNIPLFTFAYGNDADQDLLRKMAADTRGVFYYSPTTREQITQAFNDAMKQVAPAVGVAGGGGGGGAFTLSPYSSQAYGFPIDSTIKDLKVTIIHDGVVGDLSIGLIGPDGMWHLVPASNCSLSGTETLCLYTINSPQIGWWQIIYNSQTSNQLKINDMIDGSVKEVIPYSLSVTSLNGDTIQYPNPVLLLATFNKELPIMGAQISGTIEFPDGSIHQLDFRDDGVAPDYETNDGNYSSTFTNYTMNGVYKIRVSVSNDNGTASMTYRGLQPSIAEDGTTPSRPQDVVIGEYVDRVYNLQVTLQGVVNDDHGNDFASATGVVADNSDHAGKIDAGGDVDYFKVLLPDPCVSQVVFRVTNLSSGMQPVLSVYDQNGTLIQEKAYSSGVDYVSITINPNCNGVFYASIRHVNSNGTGTYYFSAGKSIGSDSLTTKYSYIINPNAPFSYVYGDFNIQNLSGNWDDGYYEIYLDVLAFDFRFYGTKVNTIRVSTNGYLTFDGDNPIAYANSSIPNKNSPNAIAAPFWDDLNLTGLTGRRGLWVGIYGTAPNRQLVLEWYEVPSFYFGTEEYSFEVILYESIDKIKFQYLNVISGTSNDLGTFASVGLENHDGTKGIDYPPPLSNNQAIEFIPINAHIGETISTPSAPTGQTQGIINTFYSFTNGGSTSSLGHFLEYQFDWWGNTMFRSPWGPATQAMAWAVAGTYFVRARARCSQDPSIVSFWSPALTVRILPPAPPVDYPPFGYFDIPVPDSTLSGVVQVGGWALDDVMVMKVELRSDIPFWLYIGDLYYTCGTRPDVEAMYPTYPNNDCAGFGYMWLTNSMSETIDPQTGRRLEGTTHRFYLRIYDTAGHSVDIGHRNITLRNDTSVAPFGAMDVPLAGEIVSGPVNISGWALAKGGWRVNQASVRLDGVVIGQANYGLHWPALAQVFPVSVYPYSENAAYTYSLNTTLFSNGQHALDVVVADEVGNLAGIGSRYFYIQN